MIQFKKFRTKIDTRNRQICMGIFDSTSRAALGRQQVFRVLGVTFSIIFMLSQSSCLFGALESGDGTPDLPTVSAAEDLQPQTTFLPLVTVGPEVTPTPAPTVVPQAGALPPNMGISNPCAEGQFRDLSNNVCLGLDRPDYGFAVERFMAGFDVSNVIAAGCSEDALEDALAQAGAGGTVQLPACTFSVGRVDLPSGVMIQGSGIGQTIVSGRGCSETDSAKTIFDLTGRSNVVFRDMTLDAGGQNCVMLSVENSDNVLVERVEVKNSQRTGLKFRRGVNNITIRYANIFENGEFHGVDSKDCKTGADLSSCGRDLWSAKYAVYSNVLRGHGTHGLNIHAIRGEIAGNLSYANGYGGKLYDGQCLWVHHNLISNNDNWGLFIAPTLDIDERISRDLYFYRNVFSGFQNNDHFAWGITEEGGEVRHPADRISDVYLIDNSYDGRIKTDSVAINICPDTTEWVLGIDNAQAGDVAICALGGYISMGGSVTPSGSCE